MTMEWGGEESTCQCSRCKRQRFDLWVGRIARVGNGNPLQYSCLRNPMDRGASWATVHEVAESDMTGHMHIHVRACMHTHTHTHTHWHKYIHIYQRNRPENPEVNPYIYS